MRKIFVAVGLAALAALVLACGSGKTSSTVGGGGSGDTSVATDAGPTTAAIGATITLTNTLLGDTTSVDITVASPEQHSSDNSGFLKPDNGVYLVVTVSASVTQGTYSANPFNFKFVAADGSAYDPAFATFDPALNAIDLNVGQKTSGKVTFDVPAAAITGGKIQIDGFGADFNEPAAYWTL